MNELKNIVVGVDFSNCSRTALIQAARLARWNNATLHVAHVIHGLVLQELAEATRTTEADLGRQTHQDAMKQLDALVAQIDAPPKIELDVRIGSPLDQLLAKLTQAHADLLVLGVYGNSGPGVGAGIFATKCARKARTNVMLVHEEHRGAFGTVVACVDLSPTSAAALQQAVRVARQDGAKLRIVHIFQGPWQKLHYKGPTPEASPAFRKQYMDRLTSLLDDFVTRHAADSNGLDLKAELFEQASYGRGIVEYARQQDADLVVLGTKGHTNLRYLLLGSTAERVLRESHCSVLAIKPPGEAADL